MGQHKLLFKKGEYLNVVGEKEEEGEEIWYGVARQNILASTNSLVYIEWMEEVDKGTFLKSGHLDKIPKESILGKVVFREFKKEKNQGKERKKLFILHTAKSQRVKKEEKIKSEEEPTKKNTGRKRKATDGAAKKTKPSKKSTKVAKPKKAKEPKPKKAKVDKSNPNWRLKPNLSVTVLDKDPLFETKEKVPFVSSSAHSKLIIRAVKLSDLHLLRQLINNTEEICSLFVEQSLSNDMTALRYAVKGENLEAIKLLLKPNEVIKKKEKSRCGRESCLLPHHGSGTYNYRSLGVKHIRKINLSRGSREGNNAFTKDRNIFGDSHIDAGELMSLNLNTKFIFELSTLVGGSLSKQELIDNVHRAIRNGHWKLASVYISKDLAQGGHQFSKFFIDALEAKGDPWTSRGETIREASARKKTSESNKNLTLLHAACVNPDPGPLKALYGICPDLYLVDDDHWKLVHYAAASETTRNLEFLAECGANLEDQAKEGLTPLIIACQSNRAKNAEFIIGKICSPDTPAKLGKGKFDLARKDSWAPIHLAVSRGHVDVVQVLLKSGADANKALNTAHDKMTPLMLAAANDDIRMVKILVKNAKVEKGDRFKRTALTHAIINGSTKVASFLLSMGANVNGVDSSGNSQLHYACAYGWWFCMQLLIQAGADLNVENEWKLTPLSVAFLKGNKGIGRFLSLQPGVDIEVRDDKGRTILLNMLVNNDEPFTRAKMNEVTAFIDEHHANPQAIDNNGSNALHYLAGLTPANNRETDEFKAVVNDMVDYFLLKGVSPFKANGENKLPVDIAVQSKYIWGPRCSIVNVSLISKFLTSMQTPSEQDKTKLKPIIIRDLIQKTFHILDLPTIGYYKYIYNEMKNLLDKWVALGIIKNFDFMDELHEDPGHRQDKTVCTVFSKICEDYERKSHIREFDVLDIYVEMVRDFINTFAPKFSFRKNEKFEFHALISMCRSNDTLRGFNMLMEYDPDIHVVDEVGKDALYFMISKSERSVVDMLISKGADPNRVRRLLDSTDNPLLLAISCNHHDIITLLLDKGANVSTYEATGTSAIHQVIKICANKKSKANLELVKLMLDRGADVNQRDSRQQTPLHLAVNECIDGPDMSLELEMLLLRRGGSLGLVDISGRTPLHLAFLDNHHHDGHIDPIQIVSILVEDLSVDAINVADNAGCTALHYAAQRGATVCALLLLQKGAILEAKDANDQTPLSYAVKGRHEGCTLMFIQREANLNVMIKENVSYSKRIVNKSLWRYLPEHYEQDHVKNDTVTRTFFHNVVLNGWLGVIYIVIDKMEKFGVNYAEAVEVALLESKLQFAKNLVSRVVNLEKLAVINANGRNLMSTLAYYNTPGNKELTEDLFQLLLEANVPCDVKDYDSCYALHYASLNHSLVLINNLLNQESAVKFINEKNEAGRDALTAYLWTLDKMQIMDEQGVHGLLRAGADVDTMIPVDNISFLTGSYQFKHNKDNFVKDFNETIRITPLIMAVIREDKKLAESLLRYDANPNLADSRGCTPLMYALKTNQKEMLNLLINEYKAKIGFKELEHCIAIEPMNELSPSYDNAGIFKEMLQLYAGFLSQGKMLNRLCQRAVKCKASKILAVLESEGDVSSITNDAEMMDISNGHVGVDFQDDANSMWNKLNADASLNEIEIEKEPPSGCIVHNGFIHEDYDVLLNKVNVEMGAWGMYNFYKMQIWKDDNKDLYVLFTNWGRIETYGQGNYQNTPYSKAEEAEEEFKKIFKSKTKNDWDDRAAFLNQPKKYRLVRKDLTSKIKKSEVKFDLKTKQACKLPLAVGYFLKTISDVGMIKQSFSSEINVDRSVIPFGRIHKSSVKEALDILYKLEPLINKLEELKGIRWRDVAGATEDILMQELEVAQKLSELSSEYYHLVPTGGFEYEKVKPIDGLREQKKEIKRLKYMLEFQLSEAVLLGAMYRRDSVHPLDYVYQTLDSEIVPLEEQSLEAQLLLKYMYRSNGAKNYRVWSIFRFGEDQWPVKSSKTKLLWHGTKKANLLSILKKGLLVDAPFAQRTGRCYGDGVYFADMFDKSISYCDSYGETKYLLLCEVDLESCFILTPYQSWNDNTQQKVVKVLGANGPTESKSLKTVQGYKIPVGEVDNQVTCKPDTYRYPHKHEYVVSDESCIRIRYIVCLGDEGTPTLEELNKPFTFSDSGK